jgi:hypothetical protein
MSNDSHDETLSYAKALSDVIGTYMPPDRYEVELHERQVKVRVDNHTWSFAAAVISNQALSELSAALHESKSRGEDPIDELVIQMGHLAESDDF